MKTRRKRPLPEDWATGDEIASYKIVASSDRFQPGSKIYSLHANDQLALIGEGEAVKVQSLVDNNTSQTLDCDGGVATDAIWAGDRAAVSTSAGKVIIFSPISEENPGSFLNHSGSVNGLVLHPSGEILASVSDDQTYSLYDLTTMTHLTQVQTGTSKLLPSHSPAPTNILRTHLRPISPRWPPPRCRHQRTRSAISRPHLQRHQRPRRWHHPHPRCSQSDQVLRERNLDRHHL
jgi:WD40 repeat protein